MINTDEFKVEFVPPDLPLDKPYVYGRFNDKADKLVYKGDDNIREEYNAGLYRLNSYNKYVFVITEIGELYKIIEGRSHYTSTSGFVAKKIVVLMEENDLNYDEFIKYLMIYKL